MLPASWEQTAAQLRLEIESAKGGCRLFAGFNPASESLAKHADRTEFRRSRKLIAASRAGALGLRAHGPNRPSVAIRASQRAWISSSISAGSDTVRPTSSRNSAV